jgi:signal transduction histidine kinase
MLLYYQFIPFAIWAAFQFDIRLSLLTGMIISVVCLYGTIVGYNNVQPTNPNTAIVLAQIFISIIYLIILVINAIISDRKKAYAQLLKLNTELEQRVQDRTHDLTNANQQLEAQKNRAVQALDALKQSHARLMESEKMASLGLLTSGVAHEIKNPLNAMSANMLSIKSNTSHVAEVIENTRIDDSIKYDVTHTEENTECLISATEEGIKRTSGIIADLCAFARSDEQEMVKTDLHRNIDSTLNLLTSELKNHVTIIKEYGDIPPLLCHPGKLNQVIMNILINAIHALQTKKDAVITIKTALKDNSIIIIISDNAGGIKKEILDNIFKPFFTTKPSGSGSGLGLFISYNIIREHGGTIIAESEVGKGTQFIITLPTREA